MEAPINFGRLFALAIAILGSIAIYKLIWWAGPAIGVAFLIGVAFAFGAVRLFYGRWP